MAKNTKKPTAKKATKKAPKKAVAKKAPKKKVPATKAAPKKAAKPAKPVNKQIADVEHLMLMMAEYGVTELNLEDGKKKIELKRGVSSVAAPVAMAPAPVALAPAAVPAAAPATPAPEAAPAENYIEITSPMVGTFYAAPSPDSPPFIKTGDTVNDATVVCIVEAMKVMNEIQAECNGTIAEVCVKNAEPVEFGQVLFKVKPA